MADTEFLLRAIELSEKSLFESQGGPFGAVIVKDGKIIAEGRNEVTSTNDPTAHAEVQAIRKAGKVIGDFNLAGSVLYSSCEPCPMCLSAIYWARIDRVIYANTRHDAAEIGFDDAFIYSELGKDAAERRVSCVHHPLEPANAVFQAWLNKLDKTPY